MDRLKATNSVAFASRDIAPVTGTPQYATDGDPATSTPATIWPAYAFNMVQDELLAVIDAASITPDDTDWTQLLQAIMAMPGKNMHVATATGTFTIPDGVTKVRATVIGGGGAGGYNNAYASGGGGSGGRSVKICSVTPGASIAITVGAGGVAPTVSPGNGGNGGTSSFGTFCSATGGVGGQGGTVAAMAGGAGGAGSGGDLNDSGEYGLDAVQFSSGNPIGAMGGKGGGPGGGRGTTGSIDGISGKGYGGGGGGGGALAGGAGGGASGGDGHAGIVIVEW